MSSSALLVLDMQNFFLDEESHAFVPSAAAIVPNIDRLIGQFRRQGRPVVFTRHAIEDGEDAGIMERWWSEVVREGSRQSMISDRIRLVESDKLIRKTRYSAFIGTDLEEFLMGSGVRNVVVTGVITHLCCESTAREAFMRDFVVYFVVDATASWTEDLHLSSLKTIADGFGLPVETADLIISGV